MKASNMWMFSVNSRMLLKIVREKQRYIAEILFVCEKRVTVFEKSMEALNSKMHRT